MKVLQIAFGSMAALSFALLSGGCDVSVQGGVYSNAWYNVYGQECSNSASPRPGCDYYADGSKVSLGQDPYYNNGVQFTYGQYEYYDGYGNQQNYYGWAWVSPDGVIYTDHGVALNGTPDEDSRDLIGDVAAQEKVVVDRVGREFAQKYALSEDTGIQIARTLNDWATLSKKKGRARTAQDLADFTKRLYGVSLEQAQAALNSAQSGDLSKLQSLNQAVASYWGTSPETSKTILKTWFQKQASDLGVR